MDSFSVRKGLNNYVKKILDEWGMFIFVGVVIIGLGAGNVYQSLSHTSTRLEEQIEMIDLMNFNQQMIEDNHKLRDLNIKQGIQIQQMDSFIRQMYNRLQKYENLRTYV